MRTRYTVALSVLAGAVLGGGVIQGLHAQAKPPAFVVAKIDVSNREAFVKEFVPFWDESACNRFRVQNLGPGKQDVINRGSSTQVYCNKPIRQFGRSDKSVQFT
jgi:hypothetical protein